MAQNNKPLYTLYESLKSDNYDVPDNYDSFERTLTAPGAEGTNSRLALYKSLKDDGYDVPDTYDSFANTLFSAKPRERDVQQQAVNAEAALTPVGNTDPMTIAANFGESSRKMVEDTRRMYEANTPAGRKKQQGLEIAGRMAGRNTRLPGLSVAMPTPEQPEASDGAQAAPKAQDMRGPQYYGTVVDPKAGQLNAQWLMPDGSLTTDFYEADVAAGEARSARLQREFERRMAINGLDTSKPEDVAAQQAYDRLAQLEARAKMHSDEKLAKLEERYEKAGAMERGQMLIGQSGNTATSMVTMPASVYGNGIYDDEDKLIAAERKNLEDAITAHHAGKLKKTGSFFAAQNLVNAWEGVKDVFKDGDTYTAGMISMHQSAQMLAIKAKLDKGEALTRGEESLLESMLVKQTIDENVEKPHGYTMGYTIANMVPFMIQMAMNPAAGAGGKLGNMAVKEFAKMMAKRAGQRAAKGFMMKAVARLGKKRAAAIAKGIGVTAGDIVASAWLANTLQAPATMADAALRHAGDVAYDKDSTLHFENGEGVIKAFAKAEGAMLIEDYTEMLGAHFGVIGGAIGRGTGKAVRKLGGGKLLDNVMKLCANIRATDWAKGIAAIERRAQWNGSVGEVLEEEAGIVLNSIFTGDNSISDLWDKEQQIDIVLGVGAFGAFVSGIKTAGYPIARHKARKALDERVATCEASFGKNWDSIREAIDMADEADLARTIARLGRRYATTPEKAKALLEYASAMAKARAFNIASASAEEMQTNPEQRQIDQSYNNGYTAEGSGRVDVQNLYNARRERAINTLDADTMRNLDANPLATLSGMASAGTYTDEELSVAREYAAAKSAYDGMQQSVEDEIEAQIWRCNAAIDARTNRDTGMVQRATYGLENREVYIIKGNVVADENGVIDRSASDDTIAIVDLETGETKMVASKDLGQAEQPIAAEQFRSSMAAYVRQEIGDRARAQAEGRLLFEENEKCLILDDEGSQSEVTILGGATDEQGAPIADAVKVQYADGTTGVVAMSELQERVNAAAAARMGYAEQERQQGAAARAAVDAEADSDAEQDGLAVEDGGQRRSFALNDEVELIADQGGVTSGMITGEIDSDGLIEVQTDKPVNGQMVNRLTLDELMQLLTRHNGEIVDEAEVEAPGSADGANSAEVDDGFIPIDPELIPAGGVDAAEDLDARKPATPGTKADEAGDSGVADEADVAPSEEASEESEAGAETEEAQGVEAMPMRTVKEKGESWEEPDYLAATPERAHSYIYNESGLNRQEANGHVAHMAKAAKEAVDKHKKSAPKIGGSIVRYQKAKTEWEAKGAELQRAVDFWDAVMAEQKKVTDAEKAALEAQQAQEHDEAVARFEEEQRIKAEKRAEQEAIGANAVNPQLKAQWDAAPKTVGNANAHVLADGSTITGHYVLTEAGAASASHDPNNAFAPTEGFPIDENGQNVNDRDYSRDKDAQRMVENMGAAFDSRALQTPVIVSQDGIVLSGNNRTMSGDLAAAQGTDKAYVDHLTQYGSMYGFTPEQVASMKHPRVVFVPDEALPYDSTTFSRFNAQEMKSQSKPEAAVKLGKIVPDAVFNNIVGDINRYERMSDFYANETAAASALGALHAAGVVNDAQMPELRTGTALSAAGKELLENTLLGKVFQNDPDAVRKIMEIPSMRQTIVMALAEVANNRALAESGFDIVDELSKAVDLCYRAKMAAPDVYVLGIPVSPFGRQQGLFDDEFGDSRVTDATTLLLADLLNDTKSSRLRNVLTLYNKEAGKSAAGSMDLFTGEIPSKEAILTEINNHFINATPKEQQAIVDAAIAERRATAEEAAGVAAAKGPGEGSQRPEQAPPTVQRSEGNGGEIASARLYDRTIPATPEAQRSAIVRIIDFAKRIKNRVERAVIGRITARQAKDFAEQGIAVDETWVHSFESSAVGHNQKQHGDTTVEGRVGQIAITAEDYTRIPEILESYDSVRKSPNRSRSTGNEVIIYEKEFEDGYVYYLEEKRDKRKSLSFQTMYKKKKGTDSSDGLMPNASPSTPTAPSDNFSSVSDGKVTNSASDKQGEDVKSSVQERLAAAEGEVNTAPTEAQKKAGNYKMGHVEIDGLQISIENPKGSMRRGKDPNGTPWEIEMKNTYGYIKGTTGVDGDKIDVFLSDNPTDGDVYVVDQYNTDGTFDEHKVMYGFTSASEAEVAYLSNYSADWAKGRKVVVTGVTREEFKKWLDASDRKKKPFAEYKSVKPIEAQNGGAAEAAEPRQKSSRLEIEGAEKLSAERAEAVERYAEGHYCVPIRVIADEADIRESGLSEVAVAQMMAALTEEDVPAVYCREDKKIYIFAGHKDSNVGSTLAHENAHALADAMPDGEEKRQMFETYRYALLADLDHGEDFSRIWKAVADAYPPHERAEEFVAYTVGLMYVSEGAAKAIRRILDGNAKSSIFQQLINPILYGTQTKTDAYRSANPENRRGGGAGVQQGRAAGSAQAERRADGGNSAGEEIADGKAGGAAEAAEQEQKDETRAIEDFGEVLEGARKDLIRDFARSVENVTLQSLIELPLSKAFKRPNLRKMVEAGIISDEDASLAEAIMLGLIYAKNKPAMASSVRRKREITEWAQETYNAIRLLGDVLSGDKERRDKALAQRKAALDERLAAANRHVDDLRRWNPGRDIPYLTEMPDEVETIKQILDAIGHKPGDKINLPLTRLEIGRDGTTYSVSGPTKQGALWFKKYHDSKEDALNTMIFAARLLRGDADLEIPEEYIAVKGTGVRHQEPTGKYEVLYWSRNGKELKTAVYSDKQKADEFSASHEGHVREQMQYTSEYDRYTVTVINPITGNRYPIGKEFADRAELVAWIDERHDEVNTLAAEAIVNELGTKRTAREHFRVAATWENGKMIYSIVSDDKNNPWPIIQDFQTRREAEEHLAAIKGELEENRRKRIEKEKSIVYFKTGEERKGLDRRNGKDATPEMYDEAFGFRGVQFGNWTNAEDRQMAMNQAYDALMDLAEQLGLSPRALSLYGELGLAFGARGMGGASAHYEPSQVVINLTKTRGAGALAHEWWHALDNYLARHAGVTLGHATHGNGTENMDPDVSEAIDNLIKAVVGSNYGKRSAAKGDYWGRRTEMTARLFETWISERIKGNGNVSPFLASGLSESALELYQIFNYYAYKANERRLAKQEKREPNIMSKEEFFKTPESLYGYPYPTVGELSQFAPHLERLFEVLTGRERADGMMANEPRRRYGARKQATTTGMSLFDWADAQERGRMEADAKDEKDIAAEEANAAIDGFAESYSRWLEHSAEIEAQLDAEGVEGELRDELTAQMESEETRIAEERDKLEEKLRDYYATDNTPEDATRIAHDMVSRVQAEVEIRHRRENILSDLLNGSDETPIEATSDEAAAEVKAGEVKTGGGLISYDALGHLPDAKEGEFAYVERKFSRTGEFSFTGVDRIHDRGDVAYLFRSLENYSVENVFAVLVKDGKPHILHIGMGTATRSLADLGAIRAGVDAFGADKIYLVHNHPSGTMSASMEDCNLMRVLENAFGDKVETSGIILDTTSGRYVEFDGKGGSAVYDRPQQSKEEKEADVFHFDQADRSNMPEETMAVRDAKDVMRAIRQLRFGYGEKVGYLILANNGHIIGNFHTSYTSIGDPGLAEEMASVASKYGGTSVIVYGNMPLDGAMSLKDEVARLSLGGVRMLDVLGVRNGMRLSASDEGMLYEDGASYGPAEVREPISESEAEEDILCRPVTDKATLDRLNSEPTIKVYRAMQMIDGGLRPPMSGKVDGQWREATEVGVWEEAEEHPEMADEKGRFKLDKGNGKSIKAAYNPYIHTSRSPINDQFSSAWSRPELVIVEVEIPESELTSGYRAEKANAPVGEMDWKSGPVSRALAKIGQARRVILSRWSRIIRVVPVEEVAEAYAQRLNAHGIEVPFNTVPPALRDVLAERGVKIGKPEKGNAGKASMPAFEQWIMEQERMRQSSESKAPGRDRFSEKRQAELGARERERMAARIRELAERLHLDNVEVVTDASQLEGMRAKAKGFFNKQTGKITIVLPNNLSTIDAEQTLLHEAVAHYGLRKLLGERFDTFLDNVYESATEEIRRKIAEMAARNGWNFRTATEEYLAGLAENTDFESISRDAASQSWWAKVKQLFIDMVERVGFKGFRDKVGVALTDNELRYILWRSYANLAEPGATRSIFGEAADIAKQAELKVGNYAEGGIEAEYVEPEYVSAVNERFNEQLERWSSGVMRPEEVVQVGVPTGILSSLMPTVPILLRQKVLSKSRKKHGLSAAEMKNLPEALGRPIFVFKSSPETISVLTELKSADGNNLFVAIELGKDLELGGRAMIVNDILTIHGREIENVVLPILHNDSLVWADKKKGLEWLRSAKSNSQANTSQTLDDAAKKVKEFENPKLEEEELYRPGDFSPRDTAIARKEYERMVSSGGFQFQEAMQDSMLGLKKFYQAILGNDTQIEDVAGFENAYLFENRMSSMNAGEQHEYFRRFMEPLLKEIAKIAGANQRKRKELTDYLMAKHGLERNEHMRTEAAANGENADRDFAGLIGLTGEADWASAEATAKQWVDDYEKLYNTADLWKAINNATKATLEKVYLSGIISKKTYEEVRDMYEYYIPLRGWNETTSDQVYGYLTSKDGPLGGSIIKKAEGRSSMADDPIATIAMMADDAIRQGNRNLMKQRFLNFVLNHPSDVASVHDIWLEYDDVADEWRPVFADVEATDTADEVAQKVEAFEQRMESLKAAHPDKYKKGREAQHIPYKVVKNNLREHQVLIKRNGQTFVVTINGNPRAAQALNGLTNPDVELNNAVGDLLKLATWANRQLSAFYTTRNPDFVVSNFMRDMLYANCMTWVKESPRYALRFHKNFGKFAPISPRRLVRFRKGPNGGTVYSTGMLLRKWENGTLDMTDKYEKYFYEFMINGGETGYTNMRDIEGHKRAVAAELKKQSSVGRQAWAALGMQLDLLNRSVENCARFAAFVTSREFGRSIDRAIYDAKEVSVNFNKKGSGAKMAKAVGQTNLGKVAAYLGGIGRLVFIFWNAGIQGMANFGRQAKRHPAKFAAGATAMFTLGYIIPILAEMMGGGDGDDDDKNAYYNLPEYVRRSNICFRAGNQWISIPLPIEYRAMYGLGELAYGVTSGNERYSNKELAREIAAQVSQILPIDMLEGGGGWHAFIPSLFKPVTEAYLMNEGWTGLPIYRDNAFNKNDPEWTKAYASADNHLVDFTRWLNETTGGNDYKKGDIDINPAKLEYLLSGTFGGLFTFPNKGEKMRETMFGDREFEWRNMPIANRLIKSGDERTAYRKLQNEYYKYLEEYKETKRLYRKYEKADESGVLGYAERLDFLENSPEFLRAEIFDDFKDIIDANDNALNEETDKEIRAEIEAEQLADKRELVNALNDPAAYFRSLREAGMLSDDYTNYLERSFGMKLRIQGQ